MTANARKFLLLLTGVFVASPAMVTLFDFGPMGYHAGSALVVRVVAVLLATTMLAATFGIAAYLYWSNVMVPAPAPARIHTRRVS